MRHAIHRRPTAGFSLIELMITVGVGSIVATVVFGSMVMHQRALMDQFQRTDAQQNGRVAIEVLKRRLRQGGWGLASGRSVGPDFAVGKCAFDSGDLYNCNQVDGGSDRVRVIAMVGDSASGAFKGYVFGDTSDPSGTSVPLTVTSPITTTPFAANTWVAISGPAGGGQSTQVRQIASFNAGSRTYGLTTSLDPALDIGPPFNFGQVTVDEFWIDRSNATHPALVMKTNGMNAVTVAYDIEDLQVEYGVDADGTPPLVVDHWCADLRPAANCGSLGLATAEEYAALVVAVRFAVVARTRDFREELKGQFTGNINVLGHTYLTGDGYRRYIFRSTVALRNAHPEI